jgi:hypothetical protein
MKRLIAAFVLIFVSSMVFAEDSFTYCPDRETIFQVKSDGILYVSVYQGPVFTSTGATPEAVSMWMAMLLQARQQQTKVFIYYTPDFRITGMGPDLSTSKCKPFKLAAH